MRARVILAVVLACSAGFAVPAVVAAGGYPNNLKATAGTPSVRPGGAVTVRSVDPCDTKSPSAVEVSRHLTFAARPQVFVIFTNHTTDRQDPTPSGPAGYFWQQADGFAKVAADGSWSGTLTVPADARLGQATIMASCNLGDYISSTFAVYKEIRVAIVAPTPTPVPSTPAPTAQSTPASQPSPAPPPPASNPQSGAFPWWILALLMLVALVVASLVIWQWRHRRRTDRRR